MTGIVLFGGLFALFVAIAVIGYLFNNKYVLIIAYSAGFIFWMYTCVPRFWAGSNHQWYYNIGATAALALASLVGIVFGAKVVESVTPNAVFGTGSGIVWAKFKYGILNLLAPLLSMVLLGGIALWVYVHGVQ